VKLDDLRSIVVRSHPRAWYARGRHLSLVPDNTGMGGALHTNHIANFADADDCAAIAALANHADALIELWRACDEWMESDGAQSGAIIAALSGLKDVP